ncbi:MAG: Phosphoribose diphosphate:decaprenyl-phosphate phosphoribosyltransferase [candidate division WWE3 bacterium GW2011_GWA1_46_21]|uniref:Phosphoribose diphosphate:decaprenyl-phosphate phosphoribosyltransferase n=4 Tax=Katanobacteria TaxID=422282 RepID=A0A0G1PFZ0_UNCKA|nr:MAG: Phosphoribose diphosphate:decaprenyl-phosphate phosphoribosyltransferase [candidate division WWE3 bacterium GW2011_GWA1_46_21]
MFAAPVFLGSIFDPETFLMSFRAFVIFCALSSGAYFMNDIRDAQKDKLHPIKKNRPIPSGKLSVKVAWSLAAVLLVGGILYSYSYVGSFFTVAAVLFVAIQIAYTFYFRNVIIMDALLVSSAFIARVYAGGVAAEISISSWLILATIGLSLLLAFGKRRSEKTLLEDKPAETRKTLRYYPDNLLDSMISMSSAFCIISYALFTFQVSPQPIDSPLASVLPSILKTPKWMMLTIPIVIYGVARYLFVIYEKKEGESPERVLLSDRPLLFAVILWGLVILTIVYFFPLGGLGGLR